MAILNVKSSNPNLSFIIGKNPASGMHLKKIKKGVFYNWFRHSGLQYNIYFKDKIGEISFPSHPDASFEHGSAAKFNNARIYCDMFSDLLNDARIKEREHDIEGFMYQININLIYTQYKTIDIFKRYFTPLGIEFDCKTVVEGTNNFKISLTTTTQKLNFLLSVANLFTMVASLNSDDYIFVTDDYVKKYIDMANFVNAPYFIKYLIKVRLLRSEKRFETLLPLLNDSKTHTFDILFGDTHEARINFIKQHIFGNNSILDIGSGIDFRYIKTFAKTVSSSKKSYFAVDSDENAQIKANKYFERENIENAFTFADISDAISFVTNMSNEPIDVLCTEVLEHNELLEAQSLVSDILANININKFIITVPNSEFNKHYSDNQFRHDDHKWEVPFDNFKKIINECIDPLKHQVVFHQVGDKVDNVSTSSGCIITKIK